ncbi:hypothetical protein [Streptacidiphilus jiangxiensis]|nr:hypothetical protein [Streptacidiphilus jiangxiensis]
MTPSEKLPRLIPTGHCWCGCGTQTGIGSFFARGHDKVAEAALIAVQYGGSVPQFLHAHGYGPQHSVTHDAVEKTDWTTCTHCDYTGAPASVANHTRKYHLDHAG